MKRGPKVPAAAALHRAAAVVADLPAGEGEAAAAAVAEAVETAAGAAAVETTAGVTVAETAEATAEGTAAAVVTATVAAERCEAMAGTFMLSFVCEKTKTSFFLSLISYT